MFDGSLSWITGVAVTAITIGGGILLFSPYRHWLMFMLAGMLYFGSLEAVRQLSQQVWPVTSIEGYLVGVVCSLILLAIWLGLTEKQRSSRRQAEKLARQIEHHPVECRHL